MIARCAALVIALASLSSSARAGGLARPNGISARGVGMGGAWTAWSDDATALWFNPAALANVDPHVQIGGELVVGPRTYTPVADDGTRGPAQSATVVAPVPSVGLVGRFSYDDRPSRFTLAAGLWNTFGGKIRFPKTGVPALDATQDAVVEATLGTAVRVSERFSAGAAVRLGIGLFSVDATENPFDAQLSATGIGVGTTVGFLFRATDRVRVGLTWRSPLNVTTSGSGTLTIAGTTSQTAVEHEQRWPQQASAGVGWAATPKARIAAQLDWTQWSALREIVVRLPGSGTPDQVYREDWNDNWTVRFGGELTVSSVVAVRAGAYIDTAAVPDRTMERQYIDSTKIGFATGASASLDKWRIDAAIDVIIPRTHSVPRNDPADPAYVKAKAPGDYKTGLYTFELSAARRF